MLGQDTRSRSNAEKKFDYGFSILTRVFAWCIAAILILMALTVAWQAIRSLNEFGFSFLFKSVWNPVANDGKGDYGAWPMIVGTLVSSVLALSIAFPLGLGAAIFLSESFIPQKIITPLNPDDTFSEDPLRMLRAAYFASKFDFEIDKKCYDSIIRQKERISIVSQERITAELCKILSSPIPSIGLTVLQETGLMKLIFPEIDEMYGMDQTPEWHHKDIFFHTMQVVDNAAKLSQKMEIRFAALVHDIAKPATRRVDKDKGYTFHGHDAVGEKILKTVIRRMKLSNNLGEFLKKMTLLHLRPIALAKKSVTDSAIRRLMVAAGDDIDDLMILCRADITTKNPNKVNKYMKNFERVDEKMKDVKERDLFSQFQSPIRGKEIMEICNLDEGKKIGEIKKAIEEAILDGKIDNDHDNALTYLYQIKDDYIS